jgi:hypothetical protein
MLISASMDSAFTIQRLLTISLPANSNSVICSLSAWADLMASRQASLPFRNVLGNPRKFSSGKDLQASFLLPTGSLLALRQDRLS